LNALALERLRYTYPGAARPALDGLDLTLDLGQRALLAGPSGAGKSTLLRTGNGLVPHFYGGRFGGRATVMGVDTRTASPQSLSSHVGMVFQDLPARFLTDSVQDEIAFSLEVAGLDGQAMPRRVDSIVERMGVTRLVGRRLDHLSAGEQARLAIAAALARNPRLLLLDEPVTHIDPAGAQAVVEWVADLAQRQGVAVLLAEHRPEVWRGSIDRWLHLGFEGKVLTGEPSAAGVEPAPDLREQFAGLASHSLRARGLQLELGHRPILRQVDLDLGPGEVLAVVGRNGSGKTTLLRALVGLQRLDAGTVEVDGLPAGGRPGLVGAGFLGLVPQAPSSMLFAETAEDEIGLSLRGRGEAGPSAAEPWLEAFGLTAVRQRYPRDLSAGERQRLALAAILSGRPSLLLLDEPTLGMDRQRLLWLGRVLVDLRKAGGAALVATHDAGFVSTYATRAALLEDGRIVSQGAPETVLQADPAFAAALDRWRAEVALSRRRVTS